MLRRLSLARGIAALALLLLSTGCLIGTQSHTEEEGRRISQRTLDRVRPGTSKDYVLALFGEPSSRTPVEDGREIWKWAYRSVKESEGFLFLLAASDRRTEKSERVYVEFQDDRVTKTWRD